MRGRKLQKLSFPPQIWMEFSDMTVPYILLLEKPCPSVRLLVYLKDEVKKTMYIQDPRSSFRVGLSRQLRLGEKGSDDAE